MPEILVYLLNFDSHIRRLQIQSAAARILPNIKKVEHIAPVFKSLHRLSACQRVYFLKSHHDSLKLSECCCTNKLALPLKMVNY